MKAATAELAVVTPTRLSLPASGVRTEAQDRHIIYLGNQADRDLLRRHLKRRDVQLRVESREWRTSYAAQVVCAGNGHKLRPAHVNRGRRGGNNRARFRVGKVLVTVRVSWKDQVLHLRLERHRVTHDDSLIGLQCELIAKGPWEEVRARSDLDAYAPAMDAACELLVEDRQALSYAAGRGRPSRRRRRGRGRGRHNAHR